jgi:hypothetical protein
MTLDLLAATLPAGSRDRTLLSQLAGYAKRDAGCGHEDFRLVADDDDLSRAWFDDDEETAKQFLVFAATASDGLFAVWLHDGSTTATAPIVFLGSEGCGKVIANGFEEFLAILAVPYDDLEFTFSDDAWSLQSETTDQLEQFRGWLAKECGIQAADDVAGLISNAQSRHPSLLTFVEQWAANR